MRAGPLHKELHSPERQELERLEEYFELEQKRHQRNVALFAVAAGCGFGLLCLTGIALAILAVL